MFTRIKTPYGHGRMIQSGVGGFLLLEVLLAIAILIMAVGMLVHHNAQRAVLSGCLYQHISMLNDCKQFWQDCNARGSVNPKTTRYQISDINVLVAIKNFSGTVTSVDTFKWIQLSAEWPMACLKKPIIMIGGYADHSPR